MRVSAIAAAPAPMGDGVRKALDELSSTPNPVDAVHLSPEAAALGQQRVDESLDLVVMKVKEQLASLTMDVSG